MSRARLECDRYQRTATSAASIVLGGTLNVRYPLDFRQFTIQALTSLQMAIK